MKDKTYNTITIAILIWWLAALSWQGEKHKNSISDLHHHRAAHNATHVRSAKSEATLKKKLFDMLSDGGQCYICHDAILWEQHNGVQREEG